MRTESETPWFAFQWGSRLLGLPFAFYSSGTCESPPTQSARYTRCTCHDKCHVCMIYVIPALSSRAEPDGIENRRLPFLQNPGDHPPCLEENCKPSSTFDKSNIVGTKKNPWPSHSFEINQRVPFKLWVGWNPAENFTESAIKWSSWTCESELKLLLACE